MYFTEIHCIIIPVATFINRRYKGVFHLITSSLLIKAIISGSNNLKNNENLVNELNIFPVPDGDTGTNMSMTMLSACESLRKVHENSLDVSSVLEIAASSMLRGARGNSGVILSLLFRGISQATAGKKEIDGKQLVEAFKKGVENAYDAVMNPTEGTILTVARIAYEKGMDAAFFNSDEVSVLESMLAGAKEALMKTPELLPVLKRAKVVDAGGQGLCLILEGMLSVIKDGVVIPENFLNNSGASSAGNRYFSIFDDPEISKFSHQNIKFTYCTEFIVRKKSEDSVLEKLRSCFSKIGDSVVVVEDSDIVKVHLHTNNPDLALKEGLSAGDFLKVKIDNMKEQNRLVSKRNKAGDSLNTEKDINLERKSVNSVTSALEKAIPSQNYGFVGVAVGEGIESLFKELGCSHIVKGGQTMNPSIEDIITAVRATPAKDVFILPNNKNIFLAAEQVANVVKDRQVHVVPTKTVPQGIAALLAFSGNKSVKENFDSMTAGAGKVKTGQVTLASRDAEFGGLKIKKDDIISLIDGKLFCKSKDVNKAVLKLLHNMVRRNNEFVTIIYGEGVPDSDAERLFGIVQTKWSKKEISLVKGNQPIYHYLVSVE